MAETDRLRLVLQLRRRNRRVDAARRETHAMPTTRNASEVLNKDFFELRARILELAAALDRVERAAPAPTGPDPRLEQLRQGIAILLSDQPDRAAAVQLHFSYEYDPNWRDRFGLIAPRSA